MTYPQAARTPADQPGDIHDATWGVLSAVYGGAIHPTAEGHAAMADATLQATTAVLGLGGAAQAVTSEPIAPDQDAALTLSAHQRRTMQPSRTARSRRNFEAALHGRPRKSALQPARHALKAIEIDELTRLVKADQIADPTQQRNIGDRIVVSHHPASALEPRLQNAKEAFGLIPITLQWSLVGNLAPCEFVKIADLTEHRPNGRHLKEHPLNGFITQRRIVRQQLAGFLSAR